MGKKKDLIARWDAFLMKIKERFEHLMDDAEEGCLILLDVKNLDPLPMSNAWSAIEQQVHALDQKIDETWDDRVEDKMEDAGIDDDKIEKQSKKGEELSTWMEIEKVKREVKIFSKAALKIKNQAFEILKSDFKCSQCGGTLNVPTDVFTSSYVECPYCQNTNTFEPGTEVRMIEVFCADNLAKSSVITEWEKKYKLEEKVSNKRSPKYDLLKEYEESLKDYYQKYFEARAQIVPKFESDIDKDVSSKMQYFYQQMIHEKNWKGKKVDDPYAMVRS